MHDKPEAVAAHTGERCPEAEPTVTITIGRDGRVYFHDLLPPLLSVALSLRPGDADLAARQAAARAMEDRP